jgi:uncharacterized protein (TIGR04255 family)
VSGKVLKNKPLVEALVELRWALETPSPEIRVDPNYKILLGRLYDRVIAEYPEHEQLPAAMIPDELVTYIVQHRFRRAATDWPLVQIGPGIFSVNETSTYVWEEFRHRAVTAVNALFTAHPDPENLKIVSILLRYIDARPLNYHQDNVLAFLSEKMGVHVSVPGSLFKDTGIDPLPVQFTMQTSFRSTSPLGVVAVGFGTGQAKGQTSLVWETMVRSTESEVPAMPEEFERWLDAAHAVTHDWFFKLIAGDLEKEFEG